MKNVLQIELNKAIKTRYYMMVSILVMRDLRYLIIGLVVKAFR